MDQSLRQISKKTYSHINLNINNFFNKLVIKFIMFMTKGPTDTCQSYEFTDWEKVKEFSRNLN